MLFGNITPEFGSSLGRRDIAARATSAAFLGLDAVLISGPMTGSPTGLGDLRAAKAATPETPVLANTGVRAETVGEILSIADGALVGTSLKFGSDTWNAVDPDRAARLMDAARRAQQTVRVA
jgi:predicted TIM-barrel enzyme